MISPLIKSGIKMNAQHKLLVHILMGLSLVVIFFLLINIYKFFNQPLPPFNAFAIKDNKTKLTPLSPLNRPILSRTSIIAWAERAVVSVNTYNAANYDEQLSNVLDRYFTSDGRAAFESDFINSGVLERVLETGMTVTSVVQERPVIIYQGDELFAGNYAWKIQVPLLINYQTLAESKPVRVIVTVLILKEPTWKNPDGIGIQQYWVTT